MGLDSGSGINFATIAFDPSMISRPQRRFPPDAIQQILQAAQRYIGVSMTEMDLVSLVEDYTRQRFNMSSQTEESLRNVVNQYKEAFEKLQKAPLQLGTVQAVTAAKVTIVVAGRALEVERPNTLPLSPGDTVRCTAETMQIVSKVEFPATAGEVVVVARRPSGKIDTLEIERGGATRAISCDPGAEWQEGDRVVIDATGTVATANLGRPPGLCALTEPTGVDWDDVGGLEEAKRLMREAVEAPTRHRELFARYAKKAAKGVVLYGPPGCGKTMLVKAAATAHARLHGKAAMGAFISVKGPELLDMYVGNTEAKVRQLFEDARRFKKEHGFAPIVFIDEADALLRSRGAFATGMERTVVPQFLAEMDGVGESGALVVIATNLMRQLDPALVRDGRMDRKIKVGRPTQADAESILARLLAKVPLAGPEEGLPPDDWAKFRERLVRLAAAEFYSPRHVLLKVKKKSSVGDGTAMTLGHVASGAMLAGVVGRATSRAVHREIAGGPEGIVIDDLVEAVAEVAREQLDVNLDGELAEFCEGWEQEVVGVKRPGQGRFQAHAGN